MVKYKSVNHVVSCRNQATKILGLYLPNKPHVSFKMFGNLILILNNLGNRNKQTLVIEELPYQ